MLRYYDEDTCMPYKDGDNTQFSGPAFAATFIVWFCCFLGIWKGVHSAGIISKISVPLPMLFALVLLVYGLTLEGAFDGVKAYLRGEL